MAQVVEVPVASVGEVDSPVAEVVPLVPEEAGVPVVADVPVAGDSSDYSLAAERWLIGNFSHCKKHQPP